MDIEIIKNKKVLNEAFLLEMLENRKLNQYIWFDTLDQLSSLDQLLNFIELALSVLAC